ncbi:MAG: hypothetical protein RIM84_07645 [Alphaproteobacteria bacterium]
MKSFLRWLLIALPVLYVIGAIGVFTRTMSDGKFKHRDQYIQAAAIDALQWPSGFPAAARQLWRAGWGAWEDSNW